MPHFRLGSVYAALDRAKDAERAVRIADRLPAYDPYVDPMIDALARESRSSTFLLQQASTADLDTKVKLAIYELTSESGRVPNSSAVRLSGKAFMLLSVTGPPPSSIFPEKATSVLMSL